MSEALILAGALAGTLALIGVNLLIGGWTPAHLAGADAAMARFGRDHPGFAPALALVAEDGRAALVESRDGPGLGLIVACQDDLVSRLLMPGDVAAVRATGTGLVLRLHDFTWPEVMLVLPEPARPVWRQRLAALAGGGDA